MKASSLLIPVTLSPLGWGYQMGVSETWGEVPVHTWPASPLKNAESRYDLMGWWEFSDAVLVISAEHSTWQVIEPAKMLTKVELGDILTTGEVDYWWGSVCLEESLDPLEEILWSHPGILFRFNLHPNAILGNDSALAKKVGVKLNFSKTSTHRLLWNHGSVLKCLSWNVENKTGLTSLHCFLVQFPVAQFAGLGITLSLRMKETSGKELHRPQGTRSRWRVSRVFFQERPLCFLLESLPSFSLMRIDLY